MRSLFPKVGWMLSGVLALYVLSALAGVVTGGPLDPPGVPAPTMKTLADLAPSWHQALSAEDGDTEGCNSTRFTCVLKDSAALDNETGLVWERSVDAYNTGRTWLDAWEYCAFQVGVDGVRFGWRLPTIEELRSLIDTSPDGQPDDWPFTLPGISTYWSATTVPGDATLAYKLEFLNNAASSTLKTDAFHLAWCVRGGYGHDGF